MEWLLPVLLLTALLLSVALSVWQTRRYTRDINEIALGHAGPGRHLVSGRGKGRLRGAVVALVVDGTTDEVVAARAMTGSSVFARLREMPELVGSVERVLERTDDLQVRRAVEDALDRLVAVRAARPDSALSGLAPALALSTTAPGTRSATPTRITRPAVTHPRTRTAAGSAPIEE